MPIHSISPITVYGSSISYFTGKLENYLRLKSIPYRLQPLSIGEVDRRVKEKTGSTQMPAIELADGRWMSDSTPVIQWFEAQYPSTKIIPGDPVQRFFSLLLEDYADEWLWRPAMHYRWYYTAGARFASCHLAAELAGDVPLPSFVKRWLITWRQRRGFTRGDGIAKGQETGVEGIYLRTLDQLEAILRERPFLLGDRPSLADVGFSGPFFRHFGLDPVPAEIMRNLAPAVWEWAARLWNTRLQACDGELLPSVPEDWTPILCAIGEEYLPYLCANIDAVVAGKKRFDIRVGGVDYRGARSSRYRVWCLQKLREAIDALNHDERDTVASLLERCDCWEPLWRHPQLPVDPGFCAQLPFHVDAKMIDVYE